MEVFFSNELERIQDFALADFDLQLKGKRDLTSISIHHKVREQSFEPALYGYSTLSIRKRRIPNHRSHCSIVLCHLSKTGHVRTQYRAEHSQQQLARQ